MLKFYKSITSFKESLTQPCVFQYSTNQLYNIQQFRKYDAKERDTNNIQYQGDREERNQSRKKQLITDQLVVKKTKSYDDKERGNQINKNQVKDEEGHMSKSKYIYLNPKNNQQSGGFNSFMPNDQSIDQKEGGEEGYNYRNRQVQLASKSSQDQRNQDVREHDNFFVSHQQSEKYKNNMNIVRKGGILKISIEPPQWKGSSNSLYLAKAGSFNLRFFDHKVGSHSEGQLNEKNTGNENFLVINLYPQEIALCLVEPLSEINIIRKVKNPKRQFSQVNFKLVSQKSQWVDFSITQIDDKDYKESVSISMTRAEFICFQELVRYALPRLLGADKSFIGTQMYDEG